MTGRPVPGPGNGAATPCEQTPSLLDDLLIEGVFRVGAHFGLVYVLDPRRQLLQLETAIGIPATMARPWSRIRTNEGVPVAASVRERRQFWIRDRVALAHEFPAVALSLPYHFALATTPICSGETTWGGLILGWPIQGRSELSRRQLDVIDETCGAMADLFRQASECGRPIVPGPQPRILDLARATRPDQATESAALTYLGALPEGYCHVDAHSRVTLVTRRAAELLATRPAELTGRRLCKALPWLDDPDFEDRYRAAVFSHRTTRFTARHPDGRLLSFECYPSTPGVIFRITPAAAPPTPPADTGRDGRVVGLHDMLLIATHLTRATTIQDVLDLVADHVLPICEAQAVAILTWESGRVRVVAARGYSRRGIEKLDGRPMIGTVSWAPHHEEHAATFFGSWDELRRTYPAALHIDDMGAWALLPLAVLGRTIGTCVFAYDRPRDFSDSERAVFTALGRLINRAFERAWLHETNHRLARSLQETLLPQDLPELPGLEAAAQYMPATPGVEIGGDFYDLIRLDDTHIGAVIGDVQGHDMTAAALMGQVRTAIRAHASAGAPSGEVLTRTNRLLVEFASGRFTSCLYLTVDLATGTACLANAGHLPPLLSRPGSPTQVLDPEPNLLLGIDPDITYVTTELRLPPGSILALYTDGLIEQPGGSLTDAIADLAARVIPAPAQPLHSLAESLISPTTNEQRTDDTALLLLRNHPP